VELRLKVDSRSSICTTTSASSSTQTTALFLLDKLCAPEMGVELKAASIVVGMWEGGDSIMTGHQV